MLGLGLVQRDSVVRGDKNIREDVRLWTSRASYDCKSRSRRSITSAKRRRGQKVSSIIQNDVSGSSIDKNMHRECTGQNGSWEISKGKLLLPIKYSAANFLAALMWRKPLNSAVLTVPTHRGPERVSNGTSTQVVAWMINKWRAKIV